MNEQLQPDLEAIETKLAAARTRLILDKPFLGALVLRLPMVAAKQDWCATTATDARKFYFNPEYIDDLSLAQTQFMLAHEALHCALSHFARRQHRIKHRWDLACDYAINPLLIDEGLTPPPNAQIMPDYHGMTAEEIYPLLDEHEDQETLDQHVYDNDSSGGGQGGGSPPPQTPPPSQEQSPPQASEPEQEGGDNPQADEDGSGGGAPQPADDDISGAPEPKDDGAAQPPPLTPDERDTLQVQWQQRTAGAAQQALQTGKLGGELARMIDHLLQPQLPWRMLLARYLATTARDDFSYMRPSRREGDAILPSLRSGQVDIVVAVDTSGSIKQKEIDEFIAEVNALKGQVRARVALVACDSVIAEGCPWVFEPWEEFTMPEGLRGGGGTSFVPVFDWVAKEGQRPAVLVYFTDAEGEFPGQEPDYPVIWLVKGREKVPWGQRIQLN